MPRRGGHRVFSTSELSSDPARGLRRVQLEKLIDGVRKQQPAEIGHPPLQFAGLAKSRFEGLALVYCPEIS